LKEIKMFIHKLAAQVHDTDAAGVIYFANFYRMAHTAYEAFMESIGFSIRYFLDEAACLPLIVHSQADYKKPIRTGDKLVIELAVEKVGHSSYGLAYRIKDHNNELVADLKTVHVTVSKKTSAKMPLPADFKERLLEFAVNV
jgi:1,4-dihydroxy-2-naphthoyl-CoA hydrolase